MRVAQLLFLSLVLALSCHAQSSCATISPGSVTVPADGGYSADITITTQPGDPSDNCGSYPPADFELGFVSCTNCNGLGVNDVSVTQLSNGYWQFVYQIYAGAPNRSCVASNYEYADGEGGQFVTATQLSTCSGSPTPGLGVAGPSANPQATGGEPVSTGTGNYYYVHTDLSVFYNTPSLPLAFQRLYNSLDNNSGPLGNGWNHTYNVAIIEISPGQIGARWGDGHWEIYTLNGTTYVSGPGVTNTLTANLTTGTYTIVTKTGVQYIFEGGQLSDVYYGRLLSSIQDRNGTAITIERDQYNNIANIILPNGELYLSYDSTTGRLTGISDGFRVVSYAYNAAGDLVSETDAAGNVTKYAYDSSNRLTSVTLPNKKVLVRNSYDSSSRVISQTNARGYVTTFAYNAPAVGQTTITDPLGNKTIHTYDNSMRITGITDPLSHTTNYSYDANNHVITVTDGNGSASNMTYDALGNLLTYTDPLGNMASVTYNQFSEPLTVTTPSGKTRTFTYDANGNVTTLLDPLNNRSSFTYDSFGEVLTGTDARANTTSFTYSDFTLVQITDALNNRTNIAYDTFNRPRSIADPNGNVVLTVYDPLSRITSLTDPLGNQTQVAYDSVGNLSTVTDANQHVAKYSYDGVGNLTQVTDALGHVTKYAYDKNNKRVIFSNANSNVTK